jgi:phenylalanine-4-hydroxylase
VKENKEYLGVQKNTDGTWQFSVQKANGKFKVSSGYSTAKVAALMRDEYILRHQLDQERNFPVKRMAKMRNEAYEQMFGK